MISGFGTKSTNGSYSSRIHTYGAESGRVGGGYVGRDREVLPRLFGHWRGVLRGGGCITISLSSLEECCCPVFDLSRHAEVVELPERAGVGSKIGEQCPGHGAHGVVVADDAAEGRRGGGFGGGIDGRPHSTSHNTRWRVGKGSRFGRSGIPCENLLGLTLCFSADDSESTDRIPPDSLNPACCIFSSHQHTTRAHGLVRTRGPESISQRRATVLF